MTRLDRIIDRLNWSRPNLWACRAFGWRWARLCGLLVCSWRGHVPGIGHHYFCDVCAAWIGPKAKSVEAGR